MPRDDDRLAAGAQQAVELLPGLDDVADVLDHMDRLQYVEGRIAERVGESVQVADHIGAAGGLRSMPADAEYARKL